jgi:sporulation protein YlmC with PRC-barrel domain
MTELDINQMVGKYIAEGSGSEPMSFTPKSGKMGDTKALKTWVQDSKKNYYIDVQSIVMVGDILIVYPKGSPKPAQSSAFAIKLGSEFGLKQVSSTQVL